MDQQRMNVPPIDLQRELQEVGPDIEKRIKQVITSGHFILGKEVEAFEAQFASFVGAKYAVGLSSGTDALRLALHALGVGSGDEVVTTSWTFIATVSAILETGARPVFADIDPKNFTLAADQVESVLTKKTRAILPVHLYGHPCNMGAFGALSKKHGLLIVEDCAQAHGAKIGGKSVGTMGAAGCFSFYPTKNLGAFGDAGAITTNDAALAEKLRRLRAHGTLKKYIYADELGSNARLDELQAAILNVKLQHLTAWNMNRQTAAKYYTDRLNHLAFTGLTVPVPEENIEHVYHLYTIRTRAEDRDLLCEFLRAAGIAAGVHYPIPAHLQPAFKKLSLPQQALPETERAAGEIINLPLFPHITRGEQDWVVDTMKKFYQGR